MSHRGEKKRWVIDWEKERLVTGEDESRVGKPDLRDYPPFSMKTKLRN